MEITLKIFLCAVDKSNQYFSLQLHMTLGPCYKSLANDGCQFHFVKMELTYIGMRFARLHFSHRAIDHTINQ